MYIDTLDSFNSSIIWYGIHSTPRYSIRIMAETGTARTVATTAWSVSASPKMACWNWKASLTQEELLAGWLRMAEGWDFAVLRCWDGYRMIIMNDIDGDFGVEIEVPEDYNLSPRILQMCQNMSLCCSSMVQESILGILPSIHLEIGSWWRTKILDSTLLTLCTDRLWGFQHAAFICKRALHCKLWEVRFEFLKIRLISSDVFFDVSFSPNYQRTSGRTVTMWSSSAAIVALGSWKTVVSGRRWRPPGGSRGPP